MDTEEVIVKTRTFIEQKFSGESSGHDWWHMYRVWNMAKHIVANEPDADPFVTELGALLHDIADWKDHGGDEEAGPRAAREWLASLSVDEAIITHVEDIIRNVSFKGANVASKLTTKEGQIIYDADKLDAMGAMGIARTFAYGGAHGRLIHNPASQKNTDGTYNYTSSTGIEHFHEKMLLLKDLMFTDTAKALAEQRHKYMVQFLQEFDDEWEVKK